MEEIALRLLRLEILAKQLILDSRLLVLVLEKLERQTIDYHFIKVGKVKE